MTSTNIIIYSTKFVCNTKVAELGEIFNFHVYGQGLAG